MLRNTLNKREETEKEPIIICVFYHKGGVGKTTACENLGHIFARKIGFRTLLIDADPQCNLTGGVMRSIYGEDYETLLYGEVDEEEEKEKETEEESEEREEITTIYHCYKPILISGMAMSFERAKKVKLVETKYPNLFFLPGDLRISELEGQIAVALKTARAIPTLATLPGAIPNFLREIARRQNIDLVIIDLNSSISALNEVLLMGSDYFILPHFPDRSSLMAGSSLARVLPAWNQELMAFRAPHIHKTGRMPAPPKFLGSISQRMRLNSAHKPVAAFESWMNKIKICIDTRLAPRLAEEGMLTENYEARPIRIIPEFHSLGVDTQASGAPICYVSVDDLPTANKQRQSKAVIEANKQKFFNYYMRAIGDLIKNMSTEHLNLFRRKMNVPTMIARRYNQFDKRFIEGWGDVHGIARQALGEFNGEIIDFNIYKTSGYRNNGGFYGLPIPCDREGAVNLLLINKGKQKIRELVSSEIIELFKARLLEKDFVKKYPRFKEFKKYDREADEKKAELLSAALEVIDPDCELEDRSFEALVGHLRGKNDLSTREERYLKRLIEFGTGYQDALKSFKQFCSEKRVYTSFINMCVASDNYQLSFAAGGLNFKRETSLLDAILQLIEPPINLYIWELEEEHSSKLKISYQHDSRTGNEFHVFYSEGHFELMSRSLSVDHLIVGNYVSLEAASYEQEIEEDIEQQVVEISDDSQPETVETIELEEEEPEAKSSSKRKRDKDREEQHTRGGFEFFDRGVKRHYSDRSEASSSTRSPRTAAGTSSETTTTFTIGRQTNS